MLRIHASHPDFAKYDVYLDGELIPFAWVADEVEGYVEVYERDGRGNLKLKSPPELCFVNSRTGKILPAFYQGKEEETADGKKVRIELITMMAPWAQLDVAPPVKVYGKVEIRPKKLRV